jgi:hypothetical protein
MLPEDAKRPMRLFETRSQSWRDVGLAREISKRAVRRARVEALILLPLFGGVLLLFNERKNLLGKAADTP